MLFLLIAVGIGLIILERIFPDQKLPQVPQWWLRVIIINLFQLAILYVSALTWDHWFQKTSLLHLGDVLPPFAGAMAGYFVITFIYYWWHRARHDIGFLWDTFHQLHHSPSRIETITSFYKHPLEIIVNSLIISGIIYVFLGLDAQSAALVTLITGAAEYFYHMNIKTPHWVGYFLQRPEMHRIHHRRGWHYSNFADLPLWDRLFGTYQNPPTYEGKCGFKPEREAKFLYMLFFKNVNSPYEPK